MTTKSEEDFMGKYVDSNTRAENAGNAELSKEKFKQIRDKILKVSFISKMQYNNNFNRINDYMINGDTQPAIVYSVNPLIISAYSDEMDGVVFLEFPDVLAEMYNLKTGSRLVTSNIYKYGSKIAKDINIGSNYYNRYVDFTPIVQLFLSDNENYIKNRTELFSEEIWDKINYLTNEYAHSGNQPRKGFYYLTKIDGGTIFCIVCIIIGIILAI